MKAAGRKTYPLQITVPTEWVERIDALARKEGRSRSNWLVMKLAEITGEKLPAAYAPRAPKESTGMRTAASLLGEKATKCAGNSSTGSKTAADLASGAKRSAMQTAKNQNKG